MQLKIITPREVCLDLAVRRIVAEGPDGAFGMLPRHIDFVSQLVPGILVYETTDGEERYAGIDAGTLVKRADEVLVSTRDAILGENLEEVQQRVAAEIHWRVEEERSARAAIARLEAEMVRLFQEFEAP